MVNLAFPTPHTAWKLEIVSILAVLGESNIKIHAQAITASRWCLLPRLLPAPQALLRETRPKRLPYVEDVTVHDLNSNVKREGLNFIPNLIHRIERIPDYCVDDVSISIAHPDRPITFRSGAPLNQLAVASCCLSIGLISRSIVLGDGVALVALLLASFATSALGFASKWLLNEQLRKSHRVSIQEKVVIRTRNGAFVVVSCTAEVAQRLYWGNEAMHYELANRSSQTFGGVVGGLMLTAAVIFFANCSWTMQAAIGLSYAVLNATYWLMGSFPDRLNWDLTAFNVTTRPRRLRPTFTSAVWVAIHLSGSTTWVREAGLLPKGEAWKIWLDEAEDNIADENWNPEAALDRAFQMKQV